MFKQLTDIRNYLRFRIALSSSPVDQEEVNFVYNVFKHKLQRLNQWEAENSVIAKYQTKPIEQVFYRHSLSPNRYDRFSKYINVMYDLGVEADNEDKLRSLKLRQVVRSITSLQGILKLKTYLNIYTNEFELNREVWPFYKNPRFRSMKLGVEELAYNSQIQKWNSRINKASISQPYFDCITNDKKYDYSMNRPGKFDLNNMFVVKTNLWLLGKEAVQMEDELVEDDVRDKLLYGFLGFSSPRSS